MVMNIRNPSTWGKDALWCQLWREPQLHSNALSQRRKKKRRRKGRERRRNKNNTLSQMLSLEATETIVGLLVSLDRLVPSWRLEKGSPLCASASATLPASAASVMLALGGMLAELWSASRTFLPDQVWSAFSMTAMGVSSKSSQHTLSLSLPKGEELSMLHSSFLIPCSRNLF